MTALKRIAIIIPGGLGTGKNNFGVPVLEQIIKLLSMQFDITVFQLYEVNEDYRVDGFDLIGFKNTNKIIQYSNFFISFYRQQRKKKFEVIHGFWIWPCGVLAVMLGKMFRIKSVVSVQGGDGSSVAQIGYGYLHRPFYRKMILWSLHHADEATALTQYLADNLQSHGLRRELKIIPFGVNQEMFSFKEKALGSPIHFLHIGNFQLVKDHVTLLKAFALIANKIDSQLTLIGEGKEAAGILRLIEELGIKKQLTVLSHMSYSKLPSFYHASDILLHTSLSEGQAVVVTEAMSCGLLVCGTHVGIIADLSTQCCISVAPGNYQGLAIKVMELLNSTEMQNTLRVNSKAWVNAHSLEWTARQYALNYENTRA